MDSEPTAGSGVEGESILRVSLRDIERAVRHGQGREAFDSLMGNLADELGRRTGVDLKWENKSTPDNPFKDMGQFVIAPCIEDRIKKEMRAFLMNRTTASPPNLLVLCSKDYDRLLATVTGMTTRAFDQMGHPRVKGPFIYKGMRVVCDANAEAGAPLRVALEHAP